MQSSVCILNAVVTIHCHGDSASQMDGEMKAILRRFFLNEGDSRAKIEKFFENISIFEGNSPSKIAGESPSKIKQFLKKFSIVDCDSTSFRPFLLLILAEH